ncbi:MazG-like family protein [Pullulanibacillus sp. KACC 23026]|uniref:MazG-like family protein n=1 Tax=Pullulanibacillus sp. KACC 23026 TaxID=3028315 RepID=UPI0023AF2979|nr:MazG-like family protein [Pullulanibacillus sp. KACC 23026]WEG12344.1 MazG-like family protein [Pullulanibacillus sp. KACC 23026]
MENLKPIQKQIYENKIEKGFNVTNVELEFCLTQGELAEAFEAYRKKLPSLGEELADVAIYLYGLAEILGYDLDSEIKRKVEINKKRIYKKVDGVTMKVES